MPTIPSLERRTVTPQSRVATIDVRGMASLGQDVARAYEETKSARDRFQLADANSKFAVLKHQQDNAFDEDMDYETIEQRWDENMNQGFNEIMEGISDPTLRNFFAMENKPRIEAGKQRINDLAFGKERDVQRGNVNSRANQLREVFLGDNPQASAAALSAMGDLMDTSVAAGYHSAEEKSNFMQAWRQDAARGHVKKQRPEDQLESLRSDIVKENLPSDVHAQMVREAESNVLLNKAVDQADDMMDLTREEANEVLKGFDGEFRVLVERRYNANISEREKADIETDEKLHQDWYLKVVRGEKGFTQAELLDKNNHEFQSLDDKYQKDLLRAASAINTPRTRSNPIVVNNLNKALREAQTGQRSWKSFHEYYMTNIDALSASHQDKYSKVSWEGQIPDEYKSSFTITQRIDGELDRNTIKNQRDRGQVLIEMEDWMQGFPEGQEPDDKQINERIREVIREVSFKEEDDDWWSTSERYYQLEQEDRDVMKTSTLERPRQSNDAAVNVVLTDVFEDGRNYDELTKALQIGTSQPERLSEPNRKRAVEELFKLDPNLIMGVLDTYREVTGQDPSSLEILQGYEDARTSQ